MKIEEGIAYLVAQFAGGIVGAYLLYWMFTTSPIYNKSVQGLGTDGYGKQSHLLVSQGGAFLDRGGAHGHLRAGRPLRHPQGGDSGRGGRGHRLRVDDGPPHRHPAHGTSVNPARSLGPALVVGGTALSQVWLFIVAPLVGAVVAALIHLLLIGNEAAEEVGSGS